MYKDVYNVLSPLSYSILTIVDLTSTSRNSIRISFLSEHIEVPCHGDSEKKKQQNNKKAIKNTAIVLNFGMSNFNYKLVECCDSYVCKNFSSCSKNGVQQLCLYFLTHGFCQGIIKDCLKLLDLSTSFSAVSNQTSERWPCNHRLDKALRSFLLEHFFIWQSNVFDHGNSLALKILHCIKVRFSVPL